MKRISFKLLKLSYFFVFFALLLIAGLSFSKKANAQNQIDYEQKINEEFNEILADESLFTRFLGTGFLIKLSNMPGGNTFNQYTETETIPKSLIKETAWYQGLIEIYKHKLFRSTWTEEQKERKYLEILAERNRNLFGINNNELKDGYYSCNWVAFEPKLLTPGSIEEIYQAYLFQNAADQEEIYKFFTNTTNEPIVTMLRRSQLTEYGFNITNPNIKEIKNLKVNSIVGFMPYHFVHDNKKGFTVHLPSQLKSSQLVFDITYETTAGEIKKTNPFAVGIRNNNDRPSEIGLENKNFQVQGDDGTLISFQNYMHNKRSKYITRGENLKLSLENALDIQKVNLSITQLKNLEYDAIPESYEIYKAAKNIIILEYIQTLQGVLEDLARDTLESYTEDDENALINTFKFTKESFNTYKNFLINIKNFSQNKTIFELMSMINDITYAKFNHKLKINITPMKELIAKYDEMKSSLNFNMYDNNGVKCEKKAGEVRKYISRIEGGKLLTDLDDTNPSVIAGEFVTLINKLIPYDASTPLNDFKNPYKKATTPPPPPTPPLSGQNHYLITLDSTKITSEPVWGLRAYELLNNKIEVKHDNNKTYITITLTPEINSGNVLKYLTITDCNSPFGSTIEVKDKKLFTVNFADGSKEVQIPLKIVITQNSKELKRMWISTKLYDKDKNYSQAKNIDIQWFDYKQDSKEPITGSIDHSYATELINQYNANAYATNSKLLLEIKNNLNTKFNLLKTEAEKPDDQTTQIKLNELCNDFKLELDNADLYLEVLEKVSILETEFNSLNKDKYTSESIQNVTNKLTSFKNKLSENKASEIKDEVNSITTIKALLTEIVINYHHAEFVKEEYEKLVDIDLLPTIESTRVNNLYNEIKNHINNQDVTNQQLLNNKTNELNRSIEQIKIYIPLKKAYDKNVVKYQELKATGNYTTSSISLIEQKLNVINETLSSYDYHNFNTVQPIIDMLPSLLVKKNELNFENGEYTVTIRVMHHIKPNEHSHINSCFSYRAKVVVDNNNVKVIIRLFPLKNKENTITGVITKLLIEATELNYPNGKINTTISHESTTKTYSHPEFAEFVITQDKLSHNYQVVVDLESGTPLFNEPHNEKIKLVIDFQNMIKNYNSLEVEKRQLVLAYDTLEQDIERYKNKLDNSFIEKIKQLREQIFTDINNINLTNEALNVRKKEIAKFFNAFEDFEYFSQKYPLAVDQVNEYKTKMDKNGKLIYNSVSVTKALTALEESKIFILNKIYSFYSNTRNDINQLSSLFTSHIRLNTNDLDEQLILLLTYKDYNALLVTEKENKVKAYKEKISQKFLNENSPEYEEKNSLISEIEETIKKIRGGLNDADKVDDVLKNFSIKNSFVSDENGEIFLVIDDVKLEVSEISTSLLNITVTADKSIFELKNKNINGNATVIIKITFTKNKATASKNYTITFTPKAIVPTPPIPPAITLNEINEELAKSLQLTNSIISDKLLLVPSEAIVDKLLLLDKLVFNEKVTNEQINQAINFTINKETYQAKLLKEGSQSTSMADSKVFASRDVEVYLLGSQCVYKVLLTNGVTQIKYKEKVISLTEKTLNGEKVQLLTLVLNSKETDILLSISANGMPGSHNVRLFLTK